MTLIRFRTRTGKEVLNSSSLTWVDRERNEENGFTALRMLLQVCSGKTYNLIYDELKILSVLFIISLSDYNQTLYEDENTNRMQESEKVFGNNLKKGGVVHILKIYILGQMLNNFFFKNTSFIVFFNKVDLFKEKLKTAPITIAYKDYLGKQDYDEAL